MVAVLFVFHLIFSATVRQMVVNLPTDEYV
jgi:hypothetical protein